MKTFQNCGLPACDNPGQREAGLLDRGDATIDARHSVTASRIEDHSGDGATVRDLNAAAARALAKIQQEIKSRLWQESLADGSAGRRDPGEPGDVTHCHRRAQLRPKRVEDLDVCCGVDGRRQRYRIDASGNWIGITANYNHRGQLPPEDLEHNSLAMRK
jgi:hypothetical protein